MRRVVVRTGEECCRVLMGLGRGGHRGGAGARLVAVKTEPGNKRRQHLQLGHTGYPRWRRRRGGRSSGTPGFRNAFRKLFFLNGCRVFPFCILVLASMSSAHQRRARRIALMNMRQSLAVVDGGIPCAQPEKIPLGCFRISCGDIFFG